MSEKISVRAGWCRESGVVLCGEDLSVGTGLKTPRGKLSCAVKPLCEVGWEGFRLSLEVAGINDCRRRSWVGILLLGPAGVTTVLGCSGKEYTVLGWVVTTQS